MTCKRHKKATGQYSNYTGVLQFTEFSVSYKVKCKNLRVQRQIESKVEAVKVGIN